MKKSIIALAVAGAMTVPMVAQADATLFGSTRFDITDKDGDTHLNSQISRVRIGVKGEETMDSGLTAGYFIRLESDGAETGNGQNVHVDKIALYVAGGFGKVILGDADAPQAYVAGRTAVTAIHDGALEFLDDEFKNGGISYESNTTNGFQFRAGVGDIDGGDTAANSNENTYGLSVAYDTDVFGVTLAAGEENEESVAGISAQVSFGSATLAASYYDKDSVGDYASISGKYVINKLTLAAQFETTDRDAYADDATAFNVSAKYDLGGNASVALSAIEYNDDAETQGTKADEIKLRYAISF